MFRVLTLLATVVSCVTAAPVSAAECSAESVFVDLAAADTHLRPDAGQGFAQTFVALDTLISEISVWRQDLQSQNSHPMKLWITLVDESGEPLTRWIVQEGPTLMGILGDGVHHTRIRYEFDPPLSLPARGTYAFFIQEPCVGFFDLMVSTTDLYSPGRLWRTQRRTETPDCRFGPGALDPLAGYDLIFNITFCSSTVTPVRHKGWGQVKAIYRD
jgi:hypothetical protein